MSRREHDWYPTPSWATRELIARVPVRGSILEPCSGKGDMARVLGEIPDAVVTTNDLDTKMPARFHNDATDGRWWRELNRWAQCRWVVTNPPFMVADRIIPHAVEAAGDGVAMLLRLTYLEPCAGRSAWLAEHPPTRLIILPRISFTGDGHTDSVTCAWFLWERYRSEQSIDIVVPALNSKQGSLFTERSA